MRGYDGSRGTEVGSAGMMPLSLLLLTSSPSFVIQQIFTRRSSRQFLPTLLSKLIPTLVSAAFISDSKLSRALLLGTNMLALLRASSTVAVVATAAAAAAAAAEAVLAVPAVAAVAGTIGKTRALQSSEDGL